MSSNFRLATENSECWLRPWQAEDKDALVRNANNRKIWLNLTEMFPHPYTDDDAEFWISSANQSAPSVHLAIEFEGKAVGGIGVIVGKGIACRTGHFGYWLGEAHWGKGIATAAVRSMVPHLGSTTDIARLEASVYEWNPASMRVLEKAGFVRESVQRNSVFKDGQLISSVMYTHIRDD